MGFRGRAAAAVDTVLACLMALILSGFVGFGDDALDSAMDAIAPESSFRRCNNNDGFETPSTNAQRFILLVSTMDGYMTALNGQTGVVQWTLATGSGPLLSSSITNLELMRNGSPSRLVPSLDGGLYHVSENGIEPVPLAADAMLSSSFRFTDDSMIIGAKAIESYGINLNTGKIRYTCSADGCKFFDDDKVKANIKDEVLVISRNDKTVRAVELQTGQEKWNFSVGQHGVSYLFQAAQEEPVKSINEGSSLKEEDSEQCSIENDGFDELHYPFESQSFSDIEFDPSDVKLKVMVSTGMVYATSQSHSGLVYWQHKFETAIASTWLLKSGKLSEVDLFNSEIVPTLEQSKGFHEFEMDGGKNTPVLYLGTFNNQLYVQPSFRFIAEMESATEDAIRKGNLVDINMPKVIWRPYLATAGSRTPTVASAQPHLRISSDDNSTVEMNEGTSLVKWQDNYPFDGGYYLFPDYTPIHLLGVSNRTVFAENSGLLAIFFCSWLRVLILIASMSGIIVGSVMCAYNKLRSHVCLAAEAQKSVQVTESFVSISVPEEVVAPVTADLQSFSSVEKATKSEETTGFISRFSTDFQQETCLGRGGFGVVFKAVNRLDDCVYAVKRIALNDSERARQKVMREVKALARLDNPGIVRYYQSWFESPPPGWQEEKDRTCLDSSIATPSQDCVATSYGCSTHGGLTSESIESFCRIDKKPNKFKFFEPFKDPWIANQVHNNFTFSDCSKEKVIGKCVEESMVSSGALSQRSVTSDDSLEICFRDDDDLKEFGDDRSNKNGGCDLPNKEIRSNEDSDSLEIVFNCSDETSESENAATRSSLLSSGTVSDSVVFSPSAGLERPSLLQLNDHVADSCIGKTRGGKTQKLYLYIQMQLCQPQSLKDWLCANIEDRDKSYLLNVFHQIVRAISYVHRQSLMHRDLKPSNIFFAQDGMIKIGDFGLVTAAEEKCVDDGYASGSSSGTKHTNQVGTTLYMSPEQSTGGNYTFKVDIYALGMIFFELFYPFHTDMERIRTLQNIRQLQFPEEFVRNSNMEYKFVQPLLSHDPDHRPSTQEILRDAMLTELEEAAEALNRLHSQARQRTTSQSSGNSSGGSLSLVASSVS